MAGNAFNISSKDIIVTYSNDLQTLPILINGSGTDNIISFDSAEVGDLKPTADGNYVASVRNAVSSGKLTLCGTSPSLTQFLNVIAKTFALGAGIVGSIQIENPANGSSYAINTVAITSCPPVPSFGMEIKDFEIGFKCNPIANVTTLAAFIDTARNIISLI